MAMQVSAGKLQVSGPPPTYPHLPARHFAGKFASHKALIQIEIDIYKYTFLSFLHIPPISPDFLLEIALFGRDPVRDGAKSPITHPRSRP